MPTIRVLFSPNGENFKDFKNASFYCEDDETIKILQKSYSGCHASNEVVATFIKRNIVGVYYL